MKEGGASKTPGRRPRGPRLLSVLSWVALLSALLGALAVRFVGLEHLPGINADESVYGVHAMSWLRGEPFSMLRTGTNLPMNPVFFGVVVTLHGLLGPSLLTLRLAAVVHSLACVLLSILLFRARGPRFTLVFATLIAALPVHLGYARLAWDATAVPTVTLVALASALALRPVLTICAFALCLWVHPVTIFALPILAAPFVVTYLPRDAAGNPRLPSVFAMALAAAACVAVVVILVVLARIGALPTPVLLALRDELPARVLTRLASPGDAARFALLYAELLAGPTVYRYVSGSLPDAAAWAHLAVFLAAVAPVVLFGVRRLSRDAHWHELAVIAGLLVSLAATYLVGGLAMLTPHTERYGMFLTVPSCYVLARCIEALSRGAREAAWLRIGTSLAGLLSVASFVVFLLCALQHPDPGRARTFRTGDEDPKSQALRAVVQQRAPGRTAVVLTEDWWTYWPIRYLAEREHDLRVSIAGGLWGFQFPLDFVVPELDPTRMERYGVAWAGSPADERFAGDALGVVEVRGYESGPILRVYRLRAPAR